MVPTGNETDLFNLALGYLGVNPITLWTEDTKYANALRRFWKTARLGVLRRHHWKSATTRAALSQTSGTPLYGFDYAFLLPDDFVLLSRIEDDEWPDINWRREGETILCDVSPCNIRYVYDNGQVDHWDSLLFDAVATFLAHQSAFLITGSNTQAKSLFDLASVKISDAQAIDAMEQTPDKMESSTWILSRL